MPQTVASQPAITRSHMQEPFCPMAMVAIGCSLKPRYRDWQPTSYGIGTDNNGNDALSLFGLLTLCGLLGLFGLRKLKK